MSTTTPKIVMFNMEIGEAPDPNEENVDHNKLEEQIKELSQSLTGVYGKIYTVSAHLLRRRSNKLRRF